MLIDTDFVRALPQSLHITQQGNGLVSQLDGQLQLRVQPTPAQHYSNAQIASYDAARAFNIAPPVRMTIRAYSPTPAATMKGTGGFGFWNHPFSPTEFHLVPPQALWFFFASPENNMALANGVTGHGWKAATFNANRWQFFSLLPTAPLAVPLMNIPAAYDALWHIGQKAIGVNEKGLPLAILNEPHTYMLDWHTDRAIFSVVGTVVLETTDGIPQGKLGFVAWLDNLYAIVTPIGQFGFGVIETQKPQSLILERLTIEHL